jgi:soluble lytic murein transglycosylase-like protein
VQRLVVILFLAFGGGLVDAASASPDARRASSSRAVMDRGEIQQLVLRYAVEYGVDYLLVDALIRTESAYNPNAVSRKGAMGLMQLMPATARRLEVDDPFDPEQNIRGGVAEFARLLERYSGRVELALAAYNAGEGAVARHGGIPPYRETRAYVARIMLLYTGKPWNGTIGRRPPEVKLVRDPDSGSVLITNERRRAPASATVRAGSLGGGFGRTTDGNR